MRDQTFWKNKLEAAEAKRQAFIKEIAGLTQWEKRGSFSWSGNGFFICGRKFDRHSKAALILLQRKLKQLETTKIPFYQQRLESHD